MVKEFCFSCGGHHEPDPDGSYVDFRGYRFKKPFLCMCCGKRVCMRQFAFGRCCGPCDVGACQTGNRAFNIPAVHLHPEWWDYDAKVSFEKYIKATGAEPAPVEEKVRKDDNG